MDPVELTAGRLHLRPWQPSDADAVLAACQDAEIQRWTTVPSPYTAEDAATWTGEVAPGMWESGRGTPFAVLDSTSGALLGAVGLDDIADGSAEVGFWCAADARGTGVTTEAVGTLCRWGFAALELSRIEWFAALGNWGSRRVAERNGFRIEGVAREKLTQRGKRVDAWTGSRLAGDPERDTRRLPSYEPVTDGVVTLRPWRLSDAADVARACDDPQIVRFLPVPSPYTVEDGTFYVGTLVPGSWADAAAANVAVTDAKTGELLGAVGLKLELAAYGVGEVGYWTAPWARGRGVAGRAAALHAQWGMDALGLSRIELLADVDNPASQRAAEKGGFTREGLLRRSRPDRTGQMRDMVLYAAVR